MSQINKFKSRSVLNDKNIREASHSGTWYSSQSKYNFNQTELELNEQLDNWINTAKKNLSTSLTDIDKLDPSAVVVPHAGYYYSGSVAAYSYSLINTNKHKTIFILGPSHTKYINNKCELTSYDFYECKLGNLKVNQSVNQKLLSNHKELFDLMDKKTDLREHSIEMQIPYLSKIYQNILNEVTIVPILVGQLTKEKSHEVAAVLKEYMECQEYAFVISSDFCHWGGHFDYAIYGDKIPDKTNYRNVDYTEYRNREINKVKPNDFIENLDKTGMDIIQDLNAEEFREYLDETQNTICGQYPILIMLDIVETITKNQHKKFRFTFVKYARSEKVYQNSQSSVGYAAGYLELVEGNNQV